MSTAFLQSLKYGKDASGKTIYKYISFKDPRTGKHKLYRQDGPIYGEAAAPKQWEETIAPWIESLGFERGENEKGLFWHPERDLILLLFVDDTLAEAENEQDNDWFFDELEKRFDCKDTETLTEDTPLDYLGVNLLMDSQRIYMSMDSYIEKCIKTLKLGPGKVVHVPISEAIDEDSRPLDATQVRTFLTALGMVGWTAQTVRADVAYAYSRIAQHSAKPTESALKAVLKCIRYLWHSRHQCLSVTHNPKDIDTSTAISSILTRGPDQDFQFYTDSDHAGNSETVNKRKSQNGFVATLNGMPIAWSSKATGVSFANAWIGESHADYSSGASEVYAAGNAAQDTMALSYIVEEMGMEFPLPFDLQMDNEAARIFCMDSAAKTRLKHIDCRQEFVRLLRNKDILRAVHVPSKENLADLMTKILPRPTFEYLMEKYFIKYKGEKSD